jgi:hypothetical protein
MSDIKIGDKVVGIKGATRVTGTVMNIKEGHVHIKAPVSGVYAPLVSIVPLHKVTKLGEGAMKRKAEAEDDAGMSDYMHHVQTSSAPFDNAKPAKPHADKFGNKIKIGNVARNLAKQGMSGVKKEEVEQIDEVEVTPTPAHKLNPGLRARIDAASKTQKPRQAGTPSIDKIKLITRKEEVEQVDEASTKPKTKAQIDAIEGRKVGTALGKKTAEDFHKNVNAKGMHKGHPEYGNEIEKHTDKFSYRTLSKNSTARGSGDARAEHASNAAHDAFWRHVHKLHDTAMKKNPAYKAKFDKNEADNKVRSDKYRKDVQLANDIISRKVHPTRHGTPSPEAMRAAMINHHGDEEGNLPRHMGGTTHTIADRQRAHYNTWVAGTGGHGDRGYRRESVEQVDEVNSRHSLEAAQAALTPTARRIKDALSNTNRAKANTNKYARRISKISPDYTKNDVKDHLRNMGEDLNYRRVYEPTSAQALNPGLQKRIDDASKAQIPPPAGRRPIGKIKLMTRKEEVEQIDEANVEYNQQAHSGYSRAIKPGTKIGVTVNPTSRNSHRGMSNIQPATVVDYHGKDDDGQHQYTVRQNGKTRKITSRSAVIRTIKKPSTNEEVEQVEEGYRGRRAFGTAYDKMHDPFKASNRAFKTRELKHELGHEDHPTPRHHDQTPHDVHVDGKKWKTFGSAAHAHNVANKLSISGKKASVHKTPIAEMAPPGWEGTVKAMKKHPEIDNPYALAWWMKRKGAKSHKDEK